MHLEGLKETWCGSLSRFPCQDPNEAHPKYKSGVFVTSRRTCLVVILQVACDYEVVAVYLKTAVNDVMLNNYVPYPCHSNNIKLSATVGVLYSIWYSSGSGNSDFLVGHRSSLWPIIKRNNHVM
jgi:hypothetical protein